MLDTKVLTAVFATLIAFAATLHSGTFGQGTIKSEISTASKPSQLNNLIPSKLDRFQLFQNPEPTNELTATVHVAEIAGEELKIKAGTVEINNMTQIKFGAKKASSNKEIKFYGYNGRIKPGKVSELEGSAKGFISNGVNVSGSMNIREEAETRKITFRNVERSKINLENIEGTINSNTTSTTIKDAETDLKINSFSGDMTIYPKNGTVRLNGKVARLEAGSVSFE